MSVRKIVIDPDDILLGRSNEVLQIDKELKLFVDDLMETMREKNGLGLAAVQVGEHKRIFVADIPIDYGSEEHEVSGYQSCGGPFCVINPKILELSKEKILLKEGCLSIPEQDAIVERPKFLTLKYIDYNGDEKIIKACGWLARCFQHEIDHLNGVLFYHHLSKIKRDMIKKRAKKLKDLYYS